MKNTRCSTVAFIVLLATTIAACGDDKSGDKKRKPLDDSKAWAWVPVKKGDVVVAKDVKDYNQLRLGKATAVEGGTIEVRFDRSKAKTRLPAAQVFRVPPKPRHTLRVKVGELVVFQTNDKKWLMGEATRVEGRFGDVRTAWGEKFGLGPESTVKLNAAQTKWVRKLVFGRKIWGAAKKLQPQAPRGYIPQKGDRILGVVIASHFWEPGKAYDTGKRKVSYDDPKVGGHKNASRHHRVIPVPPADKAPALVKGSYILMKNPNPKKHTWIFARVTALQGKTATVLTQDGEDRSVAPGNYVLLK